jgi:hypothetical protein
MKKFYFLAFFISLIFGFFVLNYFNTDKAEYLSSPLPDELMKNKNSEVSSLDFWFPALLGLFNSDSNSDSSIPVLTAKSVLVYDLKNNEAIFEKMLKPEFPWLHLQK